VQHDVAQLLEHGLNPPATATEVPAPAAEPIPAAENEAAPSPTESAAAN
jgi:hypothetical protein